MAATAEISLQHRYSVEADIASERSSDKVGDFFDHICG